MNVHKQKGQLRREILRLDELERILFRGRGAYLSLSLQHTHLDADGEKEEVEEEC